jgi:hypothetical protein
MSTGTLSRHVQTEFDNPSRDRIVTNSVLASNKTKVTSQFQLSFRSKEKLQGDFIDVYVSLAG